MQFEKEPGELTKKEQIQQVYKHGTTTTVSNPDGSQQTVFVPPTVVIINDIMYGPRMIASAIQNLAGGTRGVLDLGSNAFCGLDFYEMMFASGVPLLSSSLELRLAADALKFPPYWRAAGSEASSAANALRLQNRLAAEEVAGGHAFGKHAYEFGVNSKVQFKLTAESMLNDSSTVMRELSKGRTAFWNSDLGAVFIRNPSAADGGTFFIPKNGIDYFLGLK